MVSNIARRSESGAALKSELVLAQLELERLRLERAETQKGERVARERLAALWGESADGLSVRADTEPDLQAAMTRLPQLLEATDSTRESLSLENRMQLTEAAMQLMGRCGDRQLGSKTNTKEPEIILCSDNGATLQTHCCTILRRP